MSPEFETSVSERYCRVPTKPGASASAAPLWECQECDDGRAVLDRRRHDAWHERWNERIALEAERSAKAQEIASEYLRLIGLASAG